MKRIIIIASLLVASLALAVALLPRSGSSPAAEHAELPAGASADASADAPTPAPRPPQDPDALCQIAPGDSGAWQVRHLRDTAMVADGQLTSNSHHSEATLVVRVLEVQENEATLLARFIDATLTETPRAEAVIDAPFLLRLDEACGLQAFAHHHRTPREVARTQQALLWELSWRYANEPDPRAFDNGLGPHLRANALGEAEGQLVAHRSVRRYDRTWSGMEALTPDYSLLEITPGEGLWFERATGRETLSVTGGRMDFRLHAERVEDVSATVLADASINPADYRWVHLLPRDLSVRRPVRAITDEDREAHAVLRALDADGALDHMMVRVEQGEGWSDVLPTMALWLEARPDQTDEIVRHIAAGGLEGQAVNTLYMALGLARTPEANGALHGIMEDEIAPPMHRTRAMLNLLDRDDVGLPLGQQIAEQARPLTEGGSTNEVFLARQSMLALGTLATMQMDPELAELAEEVAFRALTSGGRAGDLRPAFGALANLGNPAHLPEIASWSNHPDWEVREAAARSFRRMHPEDSEELLVDWLSREPSTFVRAALWTTLSRQHLDHQHTPSEALLALAAEQIHQNMPVGTQRDVLRIVARHADTLPQLRESLVRLAREERGTRSNLTRIIARQLPVDAFIEVFE